MDLTIVVLLTLIAAAVVELTTGVPRVVTAVLLVLFAPGYSLLAALFPRGRSMEQTERLVMSFVVSAAVVALLMLILNFTPWGIRLEPVLGFIAGFTLVAAFTAVLRRRRFRSGSRDSLKFSFRIPQWRRGTRYDRAMTLALALLVIGSVAALYYVMTAPRYEEAFTDFYMLGSQGVIGEYPGELQLGEQAVVAIGIRNHENTDTSYRVEVMLDGEMDRAIGPFTLGDEEEWQEQVQFMPDRVGDDQKVEFLLFRDEDADPYLELHLWLDVRAGGE